MKSIILLFGFIAFCTPDHKYSNREEVESNFNSYLTKYQRKDSISNLLRQEVFNLRRHNRHHTK